MLNTVLGAVCANISYLAVAPVEEIKDAGVTVAGLFFRKVYGPSTQRIVSAFIALSALGNVMNITFAQARINQELAKEGVIPWPKFWASNWPCGSPFGSLLLHFVPSALIIIRPPPGELYALIIDIEGCAFLSFDSPLLLTDATPFRYTREVLNFMIVIGLVWLRYKKPDLFRPFKGALLNPVHTFENRLLTTTISLEPLDLPIPDCVGIPPGRSPAANALRARRFNLNALLCLTVSRPWSLCHWHS